MNEGTPNHGLHVASATREDARRRLLSIKGHVEGILRMLDDEQVYCVDILKQIKAVDGALDKVAPYIPRLWRVLVLECLKLREMVHDKLVHSVGCHFRCDLSRRVATHSIADDIKSDVLFHQQKIFIVIALLAHVG